RCGDVNEEVAGLVMGLEQQFHAAAQRVVAAAGLVEERGALVGRWLFQRFQEDRCFVHFPTPPGVSRAFQRQCAVGNEMPSEIPQKNTYSAASPTIRR